MYGYGEIIEVVNKRVDEKFREVAPSFLTLNNLCFELAAIETRLVELNKEIYPYIYNPITEQFILVDEKNGEV